MTDQLPEACELVADLFAYETPPSDYHSIDHLIALLTEYDDWYDLFHQNDILIPQLTDNPQRNLDAFKKNLTKPMTDSNKNTVFIPVIPPPEIVKIIPWQCHESLTTKHALKNNTDTVECLDEKSKAYTCNVPDCHKKFDNLKSLHCHKIKIHPETILICRAPECREQFFGRSGLYYHETTQHPSLFPYLCTICNQGFKNEKCLENHEKAHAHKFACPFCKKQFQKKHLLYHHKKRCRLNVD